MPVWPTESCMLYPPGLIGGKRGAGTGWMPGNGWMPPGGTTPPGGTGPPGGTIGLGAMKPTRTVFILASPFSTSVMVMTATLYSTLFWLKALGVASTSLSSIDVTLPDTIRSAWAIFAGPCGSMIIAASAWLATMNAPSPNRDSSATPRVRCILVAPLCESRG